MTTVSRIDSAVSSSVAGSFEMKVRNTSRPDT